MLAIDERQSADSSSLTLSLLPATGLETAVRVDDEQVGRKDGKHGGDAVLDLLLSGNTGRVDVIHTRPDLVRVAVVLEGVEELHVALRRLDGDDVGVEVLDGREDVVKVGVAEVRVGLESVADTGGRDLEGGEGPRQVLSPVSLAKRETLTESGLVDLDGADATLLEIDDLVTESKRELLALDLTGDILTREGPVQDGDRAGKHTLHGLAGQALSVLRPLDSHGLGTADVGDDDGGTDVARAVALDPTILGEDEALQAFTEVLHHVVTLGLAVNEDVEANLLLESDDVLDLLLDELVVLLLGNLLLVELGTGGTDLLGLLNKISDTWHELK